MPKLLSTVGRVYLVGAGPGDPGLITLRGVACLRRADVVLYDYLVNPELLEHAPPTATRCCLGRHGHDRLWSQSEINARLIEEARQGRIVVRLKGGDPVVFAHFAEEGAALSEADIPFEVVPGITTALAAGSHAGVPLTHRDQASAVALITGQERDGKGTPLDFSKLAQFPGTLVFYMGVTSVEQWSTALLNSGKLPSTPVAVVRRCTWPDQLVVRCTLESVAETIRRLGLRPPVIFIVGEVAERDPRWEWFAQRPLFGQRILVTRAVEGDDPLREQLHEAGALVMSQPAIEILPPNDFDPLDQALQRLRSGAFDWIVFSSANGVRAVCDRLASLGLDARAFASTRIAVIGPGTERALAAYHLRADRLPVEYRAESMAEALAPEAAGRSFLLIRASRGREILAEHLSAAGGQVEQVVAYRSHDVTQATPEVVTAFDSGGIDWVSVTSSAIARSLATLFGPRLNDVRLASISPVTSATLRELGFEPAVEAREATFPSLVEALITAVTKPRPGQAS